MHSHGTIHSRRNKKRVQSATANTPHSATKQKTIPKNMISSFKLNHPQVDPAKTGASTQSSQLNYKHIIKNKNNQSLSHLMKVESRNKVSAAPIRSLDTSSQKYSFSSSFVQSKHLHEDTLATYHSLKSARTKPPPVRNDLLVQYQNIKYNTFQRYINDQTIDRNLFDLDFLTYKNNRTFIRRKTEQNPFTRLAYRGGRLPASSTKSIVQTKKAMITQGLVTDLSTQLVVQPTSDRSHHQLMECKDHLRFRRVPLIDNNELIETRQIQTNGAVAWMEHRLNEKRVEAQKGLELAKQNNFFQIIEKQNPFGERRDLEVEQTTNLPVDKKGRHNITHLSHLAMEKLTLHQEEGMDVEQVQGYLEDLQVSYDEKQVADMKDKSLKVQKSMNKTQNTKIEDLMEWAKEGMLHQVQTALFLEPSLLGAVDKDQNTALMWAVRRNQFEVAKALIEAGADVYQTNMLGKHCIDSLDRVNHPELRKLLEYKQNEFLINQRIKLKILLLKAVKFRKSRVGLIVNRPDRRKRELPPGLKDKPKQKSVNKNDSD